MIKTVTNFVEKVLSDLREWGSNARPWFRGESGNAAPLKPKIAEYNETCENYFLQTFRRQAGGLSNTPDRKNTDMWLFWAQHYGIPTRLLDWTEGALAALYFSINRGSQKPRVYMLHPHRLNELATGKRSDHLNYPISWEGVGYENIALAWEQRNPKKGFILPIAMPAIYQDHRMIAQRSCFTVHGKSLDPMMEILRNKCDSIERYLREYCIDASAITSMLAELSVLGISSATIFPDLDHLAKDIKTISERIRRPFPNH